MFCCKQAHNLIDKAHYRALKARYLDFESSFTSLLCKSKSTSVHIKNLKLMICMVFQSLHGTGPEILHGLFSQSQNPYFLRSGFTLALPREKRQNPNCFYFRAVLAWNRLPNHIKEAKTFNSFKSRLYEIAPYCNCKYCVSFY